MRCVSLGCSDRATATPRKMSVGWSRNRTVASGDDTQAWGNIANSASIGLYTDESPGLKVDPVVVLVLSLVFIFSVVALHSTSSPDTLANWDHARANTWT